MCITSGVYHEQQVCHVARRHRSSTELDRVEIATILALFCWLKPLTDERVIVNFGLVHCTTGVGWGLDRTRQTCPLHCQWHTFILFFIVIIPLLSVASIFKIYFIYLFTYFILFIFLGGGGGGGGGGDWAWPKNFEDVPHVLLLEDL